MKRGACPHYKIAVAEGIVDALTTGGQKVS